MISFLTQQCMSFFVTLIIQVVGVISRKKLQKWLSNVSVFDKHQNIFDQQNNNLKNYAFLLTCWCFLNLLSEFVISFQLQMNSICDTLFIWTSNSANFIPDSILNTCINSYLILLRALHIRFKIINDFLQVNNEKLRYGFNKKSRLSTRSNILLRKLNILCDLHFKLKSIYSVTIECYVLTTFVTILFQTYYFAALLKYHNYSVVFIGSWFIYTLLIFLAICHISVKCNFEVSYGVNISKYITAIFFA